MNLPQNKNIEHKQRGWNKKQLPQLKPEAWLAFNKK